MVLRLVVPLQSTGIELEVPAGCAETCSSTTADVPSVKKQSMGRWVMLKLAVPFITLHMYFC